MESDMPLIPAHASTEVSAGSSGLEQMTKTSEPTILVVDDDPDMRAYLRVCLRPLTTRVVEAGDGVEALALVGEAGSGAFDLVIADVMMPRMDGLALRRSLSDAAPGAPPVLLVTGETPGPGDEPILRKPFNAATLRERVEALLARRPT